MSPVTLFIRLFGPPEFRVNGEPLPRMKTRKGLYILALLALRYDRDVERGWLAGTIWPENEEGAALTYLRQSLSDLRNALGDGATRLLSPTPRTLRLDLGGADVDLITFRQCLKRGDRASLEQAVSLYRGPLLEGWTEDWLLLEREGCTQSYLGALEMLAQQATQSEGSDSASAVRYLREIVAADPLRESACRALMQALAATHDYAALTQVYRTLRAVLRREVNAEPDTETQALFARLRAQARSHSVIPAPVGSGSKTERADSLPKVPGGTPRIVSLPRPLSEFIGRNREVEGVKRTLIASRLVTLHGTGGVGKTRLSLRVAEELADDFPDGVRFVDLSPISDPALVPKTVAATLGIGELPGRPLTELVCDRLREWHFLLLLDNCEHLTDACAHFAAAVLRECPHVRILATSRQRLGIAGETVRRVPPLTLPDPRQLSDDDKNAASALMEYEAVRLFVERAQRVRPNLVLNPEMLRSIAILCRRLDGIPLAIELAAARMNALDPAQITARLKERFRLLSGGDRTAPDRQRTLRGTLDWSYDLLTPEEKVLLCRLSVFAGGWTLEATETVCAGSPQEGFPGLEEWEVMDCLTGLADHSLVVVESENGEVRYRLLETVREYGKERLRERGDESSWLRAKHRAYFLHLIQDVAPHLTGREQATWLDKLERDHDNFRAALDGCMEDGTQEAIRIGLQLSGDLHRFWVQRGHASEGYRRYVTLLSLDNGEPTSERGRALFGAGILTRSLADFTAAREMLGEALTIYRQTGNLRAQASTLNVLSDIASTQGNHWGARTLLEEALPLCREVGHRPTEASILHNLGNICGQQGNFPESRTYHEQALALSQEIGDLAVEASILNSLGVVADLQKDFPAAKVWFEQALVRNRELGDSRQVVVNLYNLAAYAENLGDFAQAEDYFRQALLLSRELGASRSRRLIAYLLRGMAKTLVIHSPERSARLFGASDFLMEVIGIPQDDEDHAEYKKIETALHAALSEQRYTTLWEEGRILSIEQAVSVALEQ